MAQVNIVIPPDQYKGGTYDETTEADITEWYAKVGDTVTKGATLVSVEMHKGAGDVGAPASGVLAEILHPAGETVYRKADEEFPPLGIIETNPVKGGSIPSTGATPVARRSMEEHGVSEEEVREVVPDTEGRKVRKADVERAIAAVPAARQMAREDGVDLADVEPTGPDGVVTLPDIAAKGGPGPPHADDVGAIEVVKPSRRKLAIAGVMQQTAGMPPPAGPQSRYSLELLFWFKKVYGDRFEKVYGVEPRLWYPLAIAFVRVLSQAKFADINGFWDAHAGLPARYRHVNLGISVDFADDDDNSGPLIYVVPRAETLHMGALAVAIDDLLSRAHKRETTLADMQGFTCLFNNIGALGHDSGVSVYPPGTAGVLNMGLADPKTKMAELAFFFDHRLFGGRFAGDFLNAVYEDMRENVIPEFIWRVLLSS